MIYVLSARGDIHKFDFATVSIMTYLILMPLVPCKYH